MTKSATTTKHHAIDAHQSIIATWRIDDFGPVPAKTNFADAAMLGFLKGSNNELQLACEFRAKGITSTQMLALMGSIKTVKSPDGSGPCRNAHKRPLLAGKIERVPCNSVDGSVCYKSIMLGGDIVTAPATKASAPKRAKGTVKGKGKGKGTVKRAAKAKASK